MSTEAASVPVSVDAVGMSALTTTRTMDQPNQGLIWRQDVLAAGMPVHFHALPDGRWLMLLARRWTAATIGENGPQDYTDYTEDTAPCWVPLQVAANFGNTSGAVEPIPSNRPGTRVLVGAASRVDFLFVLSQVTEGGQTSGLIQDFHTTRFGTINLINEETAPTIPVGEAVVRFDRGCIVLDTHLVLAGADEDTGQIYLVRKLWSRIGYAQAHWEYLTAQGWRTGTTEPPMALVDADRQPLTTEGPVGMARYRHRLFLSAVTLAGDDYSGQLYATDDVAAPWTALGDPVPLGSLGYLGGTVWPQEQLGSNFSQESADAIAAFPYISSVKVSAGGEDRIANTWGTAMLVRRN